MKREEIGLKMLKTHPTEMTFGISTNGISAEDEKNDANTIVCIFFWVEFRKSIFMNTF